MEPQGSRWNGIIDTRSGAMRVGLCWSGNPKHRNDRNRSMPFSALTGLFDEPGTVFYSLQKDARPDDRHAGLIDLSPHLTDMRKTAHAISRLDLVITVDTAVAHLAASLGTETWILLPHVAEWRWGKEGSTTPWYPSVQLFRQPAKGDWRSVIRQVRAQL